MLLELALLLLVPIVSLALGVRGCRDHYRALRQMEEFFPPRRTVAVWDSDEAPF